MSGGSTTVTSRDAELLRIRNLSPDEVVLAGLSEVNVPDLDYWADMYVGDVNFLSVAVLH